MGFINAEKETKGRRNDFSIIFRPQFLHQ